MRRGPSVIDLLRCSTLFVGLLAGCTSAAATTLPARQPLAMVDVTVIDLAGSEDRRRTVLIEDGRIVAVSPVGQASIPPQALRLDGRGRFLLPGLIDMHVHLFNRASGRPPNDWAFGLFVANGVTGVREMNAAPADLARVRDWNAQRQRGERALPRILAAGVAVWGSDEAQLAATAATAADAGADFFKVFSQLPAAQWAPLRAAAQRHGLPLAGHVPDELSPLTAANEGLRSNEHLTQLAQACAKPLRGGDGVTDAAPSSPAQELQVLRHYAAARCRRLATALAATGQVQVPTLVLAAEEFRRAGQPADISADPRWRYLRSDERQRWQRVLAATSNEDHVLARRRWPVLRRIAGELHRAGVPLLAGTDTPMPGVYPGYALHEELALLVRAGMTPRAALQAATLAPARFLGIADDYGVVAPGKRADLLLLTANPTRDIAHAQRIEAVVLDGRLLRREALDALLQQAAAAGAD